jgi:tyrosine decarboxylase/aspartate 1-decarboxylase
MEMNMKKEPYEKVIEELNNASTKDYHFADGRILGSMCTGPIAIAQKAHSMFLEANLGNPGLYPGTARLEAELIEMLSSLLHGDGRSGMTVSGGTEANITALWIAKKASRGTEVIYPKSSHFSLQKAADILGLEAKEVGLTSEQKIDLSEVEDNLSNRTAAVVCMAGTTEFGAIDPIKELAELCGDTILHVDAAFGGFVIPFLKELGYPMPLFDFELEGVDFISVDPHKMGMATIPAGVPTQARHHCLAHDAVQELYLLMPQ